MCVCVEREDSLKQFNDLVNEGLHLVATVVSNDDVLSFGAFQLQTNKKASCVLCECVHACAYESEGVTEQLGTFPRTFLLQCRCV